MSHPLACPPVRGRLLLSQVRERAFTLIELLAVIAIIGILAALTFGAIRGVQQRAAINQAKAELAVLAQALEAYKQQYGDYPGPTGTNTPTATSVGTSDGPAVLFNALVGNSGPANQAIGNGNIGAGHSFVDAAKFSLLSRTAATIPSTSTAGTLLANGFVDPWGNLYLYYYRPGSTWTSGSGWSGGSWTSPGYVLLSVGPNYTTSGSNAYKAPTTGSRATDTSFSSSGNTGCIYATQN